MTVKPIVDLLISCSRHRDHQTITHIGGECRDSAISASYERRIERHKPKTISLGYDTPRKKGPRIIMDVVDFLMYDLHGTMKQVRQIYTKVSI